MILRYTVATVLPAIVMDALDAVHSSEHFRPHTDNNTKNTSTACASLALRWLLPKAHKKKSGLTHWPCSHVVCSAPFLNSLPIFHHYGKHLCSRKGLNYMPRKQRSCTIACQICMVFYGFLSCSSFCICDMSFWPVLSKARSSPQSRELCYHAARGSLIISTRACSESPQDSAGSEGLWLGAIYSIEHRELQAALENDGKKMKKQEHPNTLTHTQRHWHRHRTAAKISEIDLQKSGNTWEKT